MAPSTATQAFGVKRKRKASTSSNETSARSDCYDPEITFKIFTCSSPAKKKPCLLPNADILTKPCEPISQLVDEDISFRYGQHEIIVQPRFARLSVLFLDVLGRWFPKFSSVRTT